MDERSTRNTAKRNSPICILKAENELRAPPTTEKERKTLAKYYGVLDGGCNLTNREMGKKRTESRMPEWYKELLAGRRET